MSYTGALFPPFDDATVWPGARCSIGDRLLNVGIGADAAIAWPLANLAIYIPFFVERPVVVYQVGWMNGTAPGGTRETGIYTQAGAKVISGAATGSGASAIQMVNVTDTTLQPGAYYMACTDTGVTTWRAWAPAASISPALGVLEQTSANPLPSTATFAVSQTRVYIPFGVIQLRSVI